MSRLCGIGILLCSVVLTGCVSATRVKAATFDGALNNYVTCVTIGAAKERADAEQIGMTISNETAVDGGIRECDGYALDAAMIYMTEKGLLRNQHQNSVNNAREYVIPLIERRTREHVFKSIQG